MKRGYEAVGLVDWESRLNAQPKESLPMATVVKELMRFRGRAVLVDNTSSEDVAYSYPQFLSRGIHVVTANKKAFSGPLALWRSISNAAVNMNGIAVAAYVYHESSVGAGLPVISTLNDLVDTGDSVERIQGVFSGTLSFLFNQFMPGKNGGGGGGGGSKFSDQVRTAKELGYTEPDPREDLNGLDVARKLTILARIVGLNVNSPTSFPVESLVPKEIEDIADGDEFVKRLAEFDGDMAQRKDTAEAAGKVLRFVGSIDVGGEDIQVGLERYEGSASGKLRYVGEDLNNWLTRWVHVIVSTAIIHSQRLRAAIT